MRRAAILAAPILAMALLASACGEDRDSPATPPEPGAEPTGPVVPVRVRGTLELVESAWELCPGGVAPCWPVLDDGGFDLVPGGVIAVGAWQANTIRLDTVEVAPERTIEFPNPCDGTDAEPTDGPSPDAGPDGRGNHERILAYIESIPDDFGGLWLAQAAGVTVVVVNNDVDRHRTALEQLGVEGLCVADLGFEYSEAELLDAQRDLADFRTEWTEAGWIVLYSSVEILDNRVTVAFDQIDARLRDTIEERWGTMVNIDAAVEVLDGTVDDLLIAEVTDIPLTTQPRGAGGMDALGTFLLRYDSDGNCLWFDDASGERVKPIWPFGTTFDGVALVVRDGAGRPIAAIGQDLQVGGGFGQVLPDSDDPTDCGAESVWVISSID